MKYARFFSLLPAALLAVSTLAPAQAPDCTGISTVFNTDPNLVNELTTVSIASGLSRPVFVTSPPGDVERLFIVEQDGLIRIVKNGVLLGTPFLDVSGLTESPADGCGSTCEQGLLGLAFDPDYANNRFFYIFHTRNSDDREVVARYMRHATNPDLALAGTRTDVIAIEEYSASNHNGGTIAFSPSDGRLYIATGDGGISCNFFDTAQDITRTNGKILRIDVASLPYSTGGNPYDGPVTGANEVWSIGLRNPYRWSFDRITGAMYLGDVGQGAWEEIDCALSGVSARNFGWDFHEGNHCPNPSCAGIPVSSCNPPNYSPPLAEYSLSGTPCAVTGGNVYRGCRMPDLDGTYFYADFCAANIESFRTNSNCAVSSAITRTADLGDAAQAIASIAGFGEDARGEIYIVDRGPGATGGELFKIVPELNIMEVSGANADQLRMSANSWFWEDLHATSGHVIPTYRVYRSAVKSGPFKCKKQLTTNEWAGGDTETPPVGDVFYYVVTARAGTDETTLGFASDGTPRTVTPGICL